jgi:hypothetical protein
MCIRLRTKDRRRDAEITTLHAGGNLRVSGARRSQNELSVSLHRAKFTTQEFHVIKEIDSTTQGLASEYYRCVALTWVLSGRIRLK